MSEYARTSQAVVEVLGDAAPPAVRDSQAVQEILLASLDYIRVSQAALEALVGLNDYTRVSQHFEEIIVVANQPPVRASQVVLEALESASVFIRVSQCVIEPLVANYEVPMTATYPTLRGLQYPVVKAPIFSTEIGAAASGREVRAAMYQNPLWEWTLSYDFLPDDFPETGGTTSDLKTLLGFYLSVYGSLNAFQFLDPDDNTVVGQALGTTDGETNIYYLSRTFGGTDGSLTEPIGMANLGQPFELYLNGTLQTLGSQYTINTATPCANYVSFNTTPGAGQTVTASFSFYYWVRFMADTFEFNKIFSNMWETKKIVLRSVRN